jgi:hypothetical protein
MARRPARASSRGARRRGDQAGLAFPVQVEGAGADRRKSEMRCGPGEQGVERPRRARDIRQRAARPRVADGPASSGTKNAVRTVGAELRTCGWPAGKRRGTGEGAQGQALWLHPQKVPAREGSESGRLLALAEAFERFPGPSRHRFLGLAAHDGSRREGQRGSAAWRPRSPRSRQIPRGGRGRPRPSPGGSPRGEHDGRRLRAPRPA